MARLLPVALQQLMLTLAARVHPCASGGSSSVPPSPAVLVNQIIGQNALVPTVATADVAGCDLGICFAHQGDLWLLFGDTFGNGSDFAKDGGARTAWRSQTLAHATVRAAAGPTAEVIRVGAPAAAAAVVAGPGLTLAAVAWDEVSATDPTTRQLMHVGHQTDLKDELTVIPTAGWSNGSHAHVWYMSVRHFDGDTWTCNNASVGTAEHLAASTFAKHSDSVLWAANVETLQFAVANYDPAASPAPTGVSLRYIYLLGTPCGRLGVARLLRVATNAALHSDQYEYFSGTVGGADTWSTDVVAAVEVISAGVGELSVTWVPALQRWLALYSAVGYHPSGNACGIVARVSPTLTGGWSEPRLVMSNDYTPTVGVVYGGYTHPLLLSGDEVYFTASFHTSYNVHLAKFNLSALFHVAHDHQAIRSIKTDDLTLPTVIYRSQSPSVLPIVSPMMTLFSSKDPSHGAPASIENYGNTLSLLLLSPQLGDNSTILIVATRGNINKFSNVPVLRRSTDGGVSLLWCHGVATRSLVDLHIHGAMFALTSGAFSYDVVNFLLEAIRFRGAFASTPGLTNVHFCLDMSKGEIAIRDRIVATSTYSRLIDVSPITPPNVVVPFVALILRPYRFSCLLQNFGFSCTSPICFFCSSSFSLDAATVRNSLSKTKTTRHGVSVAVVACRNIGISH
eukprot:COSAG02_NODE_5237_length_4513_cov_7.143860_1_plen_680_part_00